MKGRGIPREVRRRPPDALRRVQPQVRRPQGQARPRVMRPVLFVIQQIRQIYILYNILVLYIVFLWCQTKSTN